MCLYVCVHVCAHAHMCMMPVVHVYMHSLNCAGIHLYKCTCTDMEARGSHLMFSSFPVILVSLGQGISLNPERADSLATRFSLGIPHL